MTKLSTLISITLLISGCATSGITILHKGTAVPIQAIAIGEIEFNLSNMRSWNHYEKIHDTIESISAIDGVDVIAPWEYHVIAAPMRPKDLFKSSDLAINAKRMGLDPEKIAVLYVHIEERAQDQTTVLQRANVKNVAKSYESNLIISAHITHPSSDSILAHIERRIPEDRFTEPQDYDTRPGVKTALRHTLSQLLKGMLSRNVITAIRPSPQSTSLQFIHNPKRVMQWKYRGPTLEDHLATQDALLKDATLYTRYRYFEPQLSLRTLRKMVMLPEGLFVTSAQNGVRKDDLIICANNKSARTPFEWIRTLRGEPLNTVTVIRNAQALQVQTATHKGVPGSLDCGIDGP